MRAFEFSDATKFLECTRDFLFQSEVEHNLLLSSALVLTRTSVPRSQALIFMTVVDERGITRGAALRSPNRRWILSAPDVEVASFFGTEIARREPVVRSLLVAEAQHAPILDAFQRASGACAGRELKVSITQNMMRLERLAEVEPAPGMMRFAQAKDLPRLIRWSREFAKECGLDESPFEAEEVIRKYLMNKQLFVWENNALPVAMAAFGGLTPNSTRISLVYSDVQARGKGYASTLVHRLSHRILADGYGACVLFSDSANRTSNRVYEKIGYRTVTRFTELRAQDSVLRSPDSGLTEVFSSR